jgi:hypothetical protein
MFCHEKLDVYFQNSNERVLTDYCPQYLLSTDTAVSPDFKIFALPLDLSLQYLDGANRSYYTPSLNSSLFFTSLYNPLAFQSYLAKYIANPYIVYPLISAELTSCNRLNIFTDLSLELFIPQGVTIASTSSLMKNLESLGFKITAFKNPYRLRNHFIKTASVYTVLRALSTNMTTEAEICPDLIKGIFADLSIMTYLDKSVPDDRFTEDFLVSSHIISYLICAATNSSRDHVILQNLNYLLRDGQGKVTSHLGMMKYHWLKYISNLKPSEYNKIQKFIFTVLCSF